MDVYALPIVSLVEYAQNVSINSRKKTQNKLKTHKFSRNIAENLRSEQWQTLCPAYQSELNQNRILFDFEKIQSVTLSYRSLISLGFFKS